MSNIIPFDQRKGYIWFDGKIIDWKEAKIHVLNHALHYASSVFEGIAIYDDAIFKLEEHCKRLIESAKILDMDIPYSLDEIIEAVKEIVIKQEIKEGYIRPIAWRGSEGMAVSAQNATIHLAIATWIWPNAYYSKDRLQGIDLTIAKYRRPSPETAPYNSKAAGLYMICTVSKHIAEREGFNEALMLDYRGYIAETTSSNVFFVINEELHTPKPDCFLDGITRRTIIDIAKQNNIIVKEYYIEPSKLAEVSDMFMTGTAAEVTRVSSVYNPSLDKKYSFNKHPITELMLNEYNKLIYNK